MAGIYVHIPYCSQRCVYCDFYFVTSRKSRATFLRSLNIESEHYAHLYAGSEPIRTIYFGGGTPSRLSLEELHGILATIHEHFDVSQIEEVTLEANPEDLDGVYLRGLLGIGITRLSVGIQSFYEDDLQFMNRAHSSDQAREIAPQISSAGFETFTADLIFGIPDQPREYWAANLERAVQQRIPHISAYSLTVERETPLFKMIQNGVSKPVDDETTAERFRFTMQYLRESGYEHYEVSSYALPGHRAVHNQSYWGHENYLGFGPSAHSFWRDGSTVRRWANIRNLKRYQALLEGRNQPVEFSEVLEPETLANEHIMLKLRTSDGLDLSVLDEQYGFDLYDERVEDLALLEGEDLIMPIRNDRVVLTDEGMILCDMVTSKLMLG
ncbi:MAG: radical SAM family heme chaperone HemW [Rhodothermales bacterium]|nr:radical SAM family heme chaperone HemW [Rhodothermales bacterium]